MDFPGFGIVKGMAVTARNLLGSYFEKDRMITEQYPEERPKLPENSRSFPFLIYDGNDPEAGMRCVSCKICEKECPPQCIYIVQDRDEAGKALKRPRAASREVLEFQIPNSKFQIIVTGPPPPARCQLTRG